MHNFYPFDEVRIWFKDHSEGEELIDFLVYGRVAHETSDSVTVQCWCYPESLDVDDNVQTYTICKDAIIESMVYGADSLKD